MPQYATTAELEGYIGKTAPTDADRLLQRASEFIDSQVVAPYSTDAAGAFVDATVAAAFKDATCAQVEWWIATGDEVEASARFKSSGKGITVQSTGLRLAPRAYNHLVHAGLMGRGVQAI